MNQQEVVFFSLEFMKKVVTIYDLRTKQQKHRWNSPYENDSDDANQIKEELAACRECVYCEWKVFINLIG
jgi:meiotically up-regulated gene 157 (Mug157) protein